MSRDSRPRTSSPNADRQSPRRYRSLEHVGLLRDLPEHALRRGELGTIVHVFAAADAYLVEFVNPGDGSTRAEVELSSADLFRPIKGRRLAEPG